MSEWKAKRFWKAADVAGEDDRWRVVLDGREVRTPAKAELVLPTEAMARAIAVEWDAQAEEIDPRSMPVTRMANSVIDRVIPHHAEVADMLAAYAETDLLCHRADSPEALAARQADGWDPILEWAADRYGARLEPTVGILLLEQPSGSLERLASVVNAHEPFRLAALHDLVTISGSLLLGLATANDRITVEEAWRLSRIDEDWQIEQWGDDEEASAAAAYRFGQFQDARRFWDLASAA